MKRGESEREREREREREFIGNYSIHNIPLAHNITHEQHVFMRVMPATASCSSHNMLTTLGTHFRSDVTCLECGHKSFTKGRNSQKLVRKMRRKVEEKEEEPQIGVLGSHK